MVRDGAVEITLFLVVIDVSAEETKQNKQINKKQNNKSNKQTKNVILVEHANLEDTT